MRGHRIPTLTACVCALAVVHGGVSADGSGDAAGTVASGDAVTTSVSAERPATRLGAPGGPTRPRRVVGYVTSWGIYQRGFEIADVPADRLTHLNYAFADPRSGRCVPGDRWADLDRPVATDDPSLPFRGNFNQLQVLKRRHPHLRVLLSVGGSTWSGGFSEATATASGRRELAASCVDMMLEFGFDGLDIDWEFPGEADRANVAAFLDELRSRLDDVATSDGRRPLLTWVGPAGAPFMADVDIPAIASHVDWVNVLTYDFAGEWSPRTGHNAPLGTYPGIEDPTFTVASALDRWNRGGVPAEKIVAGLAFYGRGFAGVTTGAAGSLFTGVPVGTTEPGQFDYDHLVADVLDGMQLGFDEDARAPTAYDPDTDVWISYDDERSIGEKARFVVDRGYGGVMIWELSNDRHSVLLDVVYAEIARPR